MKLTYLTLPFFIIAKALPIENCINNSSCKIALIFNRFFFFFEKFYFIFKRIFLKNCKAFAETMWSLSGNGNVCKKVFLPQFFFDATIS